VHGDVASTLAALTPLIKGDRSLAFLEKTLKRHHKLLDNVVGKYTDVGNTVPIHPEYAVTVLDELLADDAIVSADTGMGNVWQARYITPNGRRRLIGSYLHGSMANAVPQAIGAQSAYPNRQVVTISGDGGLSMLLGELVTIAAYKLPVKVVVFNNSTLGLVKLEMFVDGYPDFGVDVPGVDYAAVAGALGFFSRRVDDPKQLRGALSEAFAHPGPALVDIATDPLALSLPPTITRQQVGGFGLALSKLVLNGGVGEAVKMARSNIRHVPGL
jgi:pyruvate dehydrogenase (quinone)